MVRSLEFKNFKFMEQLRFICGVVENKNIVKIDCSPNCYRTDKTSLKKEKNREKFLSSYFEFSWTVDFLKHFF